MLLSDGTLSVFRDTQLDKVERAIRMIEKSPPSLQRRQDSLLAALKLEREVLRGNRALLRRRAERGSAESGVEREMDEAA